MYCLSNWYLNGLVAFGICKGHKKFADGTYIHTSPVVGYFVKKDALKIQTLSGSCYICKIEDIVLDEIETVKEVLRVNGVDSDFINRLEEWKLKATLRNRRLYGKVGM